MTYSEHVTLKEAEDVINLAARSEKGRTVFKGVQAYEKIALFCLSLALGLLKIKNSSHSIFFNPLLFFYQESLQHLFKVAIAKQIRCILIFKLEIYATS